MEKIRIKKVENNGFKKISSFQRIFIKNFHKSNNIENFSMSMKMEIENEIAANKKTQKTKVEKVKYTKQIKENGKERKEKIRQKIKRKFKKRKIQ